MTRAGMRARCASCGRVIVVQGEVSARRERKRGGAIEVWTCGRCLAEFSIKGDAAKKGGAG